MYNEQVYVQSALNRLENCIGSWAAMRGNSPGKEQELATMLRNELLEMAEKLAVRYGVGG